MKAQELRETPVPDGAGRIAHFELGGWRSRLGVVAGITTSTSDFTLDGAPSEGRAAACWAAFRAQHQSAFPALVVGSQCHGVRVASHQDPAPGLEILPGVDGHVARDRGVLLCVTVADCVPVYLVSADGRSVGLLHAGWRGVASGIIEQGVEAFCRSGDSDPSRIISHCGVAICWSCYEVGAEVVLEVLGQGVVGPTCLDLRGGIAERLANLGVREVSVSPWCTTHDAGRFHSHRGSAGRAGRMLAYLGVPIA